MKNLLNLPTNELICLANSFRKGLSLDLCSIMNAKSGMCPEDCKFCAQSSHYKTGILRYPLKSKNEILERAEFAKSIGTKRFGIVTSGRKPTNKELEAIADAISEIKGILCCASLGRLDKPSLLALKDAGLKRFHHNIETSEKFFPNIVTTYPFSEKIRTIEYAKEIGLEVCSGCIIGMGESWEDRLNIANLLKSLGVNSVPINVLIPIKNTAFEKISPISPIDVIKTIAIFRIILQDKTIKIGAGRENLGRAELLAFLAGANGMIIGGYLTIKGREISEDQQLISEIKALFKNKISCNISGFLL
ncbi:MAG: biotin synthase BioB [bacterium]